jgi:hypothetical protein
MFTTNDVKITTKKGLRHDHSDEYKIKKEIIHLFFYPLR